MAPSRTVLYRTALVFGGFFIGMHSNTAFAQTQGRISPKPSPAKVFKQVLPASFVTGFDSAQFVNSLSSVECVEIEQIIPQVVNASDQVGTFTNGIAGAGLSIDEGIILSTGSVTEAFTDNNSTGVSSGTFDADTIVDASLDALDVNGSGTHDEAILLLEFTVPSGIDGIRVPFQLFHQTSILNTYVVILMMSLGSLLPVLVSLDLKISLWFQVVQV